MIKTIKRLWKESKKDESSVHEILIETLKAKEDWEIHTLNVEQITYLKDSIRFIVIISFIIGLLIGSYIF